jgi:hypothetical protein
MIPTSAAASQIDVMPEQEHVRSVSLVPALEANACLNKKKPR